MYFAFVMLLISRVDYTTHVESYCVTDNRFMANMIVKTSSKSDAEKCIFLTDNCAMAKGKIYFDRYSKISVYISPSEKVCR
jgi:hypothetical protein